MSEVGRKGHGEVTAGVFVADDLSVISVGKVVAAVAGMDSMGVAERRADVDLQQGPVQSAVGVAQCQRAESSIEPDFLAALGATVEGVRISDIISTVRLVEIDRCAEVLTSVGLAELRDGYVEVRVEFEFALAGNRATRSVRPPQLQISLRQVGSGGTWVARTARHPIEYPPLIGRLLESICSNWPKLIDDHPTPAGSCRCHAILSMIGESAQQ